MPTWSLFLCIGLGMVLSAYMLVFSHKLFLLINERGNNEKTIKSSLKTNFTIMKIKDLKFKPGKRDAMVVKGLIASMRDAIVEKPIDI